MRSLHNTRRQAFTDRAQTLKSAILGIGIICGALASLTTKSSGALLTDVFYLHCSLRGPQGAFSYYTLHIEAPKYLGSPRIQWVGTNPHEDLRVVVFDETTIIADVDTRFSNFPDKAEAMSFRINRITGAVEVNYLRNPTNADADPPPSGFRFVMTEFSETGKCTKVQREF
jgi:hypothetical protein